MTRARMLLVVCAMGTSGMACSRLFAVEDQQCKTTADCLALSTEPLVCSDGLCLSSSESPARTPHDSGSSHAPESALDANHESTSGRDAAPHGEGDPAEPPDAARTDLTDAGLAMLPDGSASPSADASSELPRECPEADAHLRFCDGFEQGLTPWVSIQEGGGALTAVTQPVARGAQALQSTLTMTGMGRAVARASFADIDREPVWARAYLWIQGGTSYEVLSVFRVNTSTTPDQGIDISIQQGTARAALFFNARGLQYSAADLELFPTDRWACVELGFVPDDGAETGVATLHIDGRLAVTLPVPKPTAPINWVQAGIYYVNPNQAPATSFLDAVAVSTQRIGCR